MSILDTTKMVYKFSESVSGEDLFKISDSNKKDVVNIIYELIIKSSVNSLMKELDQPVYF